VEIGGSLSLGEREGGDEMGPRGGGGLLVQTVFTRVKEKQNGDPGKGKFSEKNTGRGRGRRIYFAGGVKTDGRGGGKT